MKILLLSHAQYITVALPKIIEFAETFALKGHSVTLVVTHKKNILYHEEFILNGVNYILSPSILKGRFRHGADFYDAIRRIIILTKKNFDIIHAIDSRPSVILPALYLKRKFNIPLILEWSDLFSDGGTIHDRSGKLYRYTFGYIESYFEKGFRLKADGAAVISTRLNKKLLDLGFPKEKIIIHRTSSKIENFKNLSILKSRKFLEIPKDEIIFSYFGRIHFEDHKLLYNSFINFRNKVNKNIKLYFIGKIKPLKNNIPSYIQYKGYVEEESYIHYLGATDVCLIPLKMTIGNLSRWPSKVDFLAASKPIVATPVSDLPVLFKNKIGILSKDDTEHEFSNALIKILDQSNDWAKMGENGRQYAEKFLSWDVAVNNMLEFYRSFIK